MGEIVSFDQLAAEWERLETNKMKVQISKYEDELESLDPEADAERITELEEWIKELSSFL